MWNKVLDWFTERRVKQSFKLRNDMQNNPSMNVPIEIIRGKYKGLIYQYGHAKFEGDKVAYQYTPLENEHLIDEDFIRFGGNILVYLFRKKGYHDMISRGEL